MSGHAIGFITNHNFIANGNIGQPRGQINRIADDGILLATTRTDAARNHHAGVDADMQGQIGSVNTVELTQNGLHIKRRMQCPHRIIFVGDGCAKQRHHRIADKFIHRAAILLNNRHKLIEARIDDALHLLGISLFNNRGKADQIGKHNRDAATLARRQNRAMQRKTTVQAKMGNVGVGGLASGTQHNQNHSANE